MNEKPKKTAVAAMLAFFNQGLDPDDPKRVKTGEMKPFLAGMSIAEKNELGAQACEAMGWELIPADK